METLFVGKNLIFLPAVPSTNSYANELLKNVKPPEGTLVQTHDQTAGRGQRGAVWSSEPARNLTFSVILHPGFLPATDSYFLYIIAALSCYDTTAQLLANSQAEVRIKWPNDIYVNRLKIAGILIENKLSNDYLQSSVIGIGLNVNQLNFEGLAAISLSAIAGSGFDRDEVRDLLCVNLEGYYLQLKAGKQQALLQTYQSKLLGLHETLDFVYKDKVCKMQVIGLAPNGLLQLQYQQQVITADLGELRWLL